MNFLSQIHFVKIFHQNSTRKLFKLFFKTVLKVFLLFFKLLHTFVTTITIKRHLSDFSVSRLISLPSDEWMKLSFRSLSSLRFFFFFASTYFSFPFLNKNRSRASTFLNVSFFSLMWGERERVTVNVWAYLLMT